MSTLHGVFNISCIRGDHQLNKKKTILELTETELILTDKESKSCTKKEISRLRITNLPLSKSIIIHSEEESFYVDLGKRYSSSIDIFTEKIRSKENNEPTAGDVLITPIQQNMKFNATKSYKKILNVFSTESFKKMGKHRKSKSLVSNSIPTTQTSKLPLKIFGGNLDDIYNFFDQKLPPFVELLLETIEKNGIDVPGIYRVSGSAEYITECKSLIENHQPFLTQNCDIYVQTSLVKSFFRELQAKIIPLQILNNYNSCINNLERVNHLIEEIASLPFPNRFSLFKLLHHFEAVCNHSELNLMGQRNISVVFGPTLIESNALDMCTAVEVLNTLLFNQNLLFINENFMKGIAPITIYVAMKVSSEEEIRNEKSTDEIPFVYKSTPDLPTSMNWKQEDVVTAEQISNSPTKPAEILRTCKLSRGSGSRNTFKIVRGENNKFTLAPDLEKEEEE